ncbi:MAG: aromatic ring-hydroxylating dioxygenase subunit alpha [Pseudomonadota bacterium]
MTYLMNAWYVAALSTELNGEALFHRKLLDVEVLLYRKASGEPVAMRDRCPHRFAPLHLGKRVGDDVVCGYHALRFDCSGKCVHNPHGEGTIPSAAVVRSYPAIERHGFVWFWPGDAALADPARIPDYSRLERGHGNAVGYAYMHMDANYELIVDNIMDLSHVDYVHGPLLNTAGKLSPLKPKVLEDGNTVSIHWDWEQHPPMGFFAPFLPRASDRADHHVQVDWTAPSTMLLTVGAMQDTSDHERGLISWDHHLMTPETETSTHYFFGSRRNWLVEDAELNRLKLEGTMAAFTFEDKPIIEAQQREMGTADLWSLKPVLLSGDPAAVRARRVLERLKQAESQAERRAG